MAKRRRKKTYAARRPRRRVYTVARRRRSYRRARTGGGKFKPVIDGALAGIAATAAKKFAPGIPFVDDLALIGVGIFRKNNAVTTIGAIGLGSDLIAGLGGNSGTGGYIG